MAARQTASRGRGAMGSPSPSASSENGSQTALAKSPPRWARPITACWAPFIPPGSGRHQGNGGNDAHDLPGAEAEAALAGGIERAGHRVPDQQEPGQQQARDTQADKDRAGEQDQNADTGKGTLLRQPRPVLFPCPGGRVRWSIGRHRESKRPHPLNQPGRRPRRIREGAGQLRGEQEAERAHDGQFVPAAGLARPGSSRMRSVARASPVASMAPRRSSSR